MSLNKLAGRVERGNEYVLAFLILMLNGGVPGRLSQWWGVHQVPNLSKSKSPKPPRLVWGWS